MKKLLYSFVLIYCFSAYGYSQERMRIVVMDLKPIGLKEHETKALSKLLESDIVDSKLFTVVERSQIDVILQEQGLQMTGCTDESCIVEVGKLLSANKILLGNASRLGKAIIITVRIVDVEKGVSEFSVSQKAKSLEVADEAINLIVKKLIGRLGGESSGRFATKIGTPAGFTVTDGDYHKDKIVLKWKKVKGADNYYIYRYNDDKEKFEKIHSTKKTGFEDYKTEAAESYKYKVRAGFYSKTGKFTDVKTGSRGKSSTGYYMRGFIPGWSQFYYNHNIKGAVFLSGFLLSSAFTVFSFVYADMKHSAYYDMEPGPPQSEFDSAYDDYKSASTMFRISLGIWAGIYLIHWIDVLFFNEPIYEGDVAVNNKKNSTYMSFNIYKTSKYYKERRFDIGCNLRF